MNKLFILLFSFLLFTTACKKDSPVDPNPVAPENMADMKVNANFDWKTTQDVQITMTGKVNNLVSVTSDQGQVYQKAFLKANQPYTMKLTIPSYETSVRLKYMGQDISLDLGNGTLSYQFQ